MPPKDRLISQRRLSCLFLVILLAAAVGPGCRQSTPAPGEPDAPESRSLSVFAASSLTEAFTDLALDFERVNPGVDVQLHFAGSQTLRTQIENGAPADVFASANQAHMQALLDEDLVRRSRIFAHNDLIIVTPAENPARIESARDLAQAKRLVIGTRSVPVGRYTAQFLERAAEEFGPDFRRQVEHVIVSRENNVRLVLSKIVLGEADAGIVYRTDARARGDQVRTVEIPENLNIRANYPIAVVSGSSQAALGDAWIAFMQSRDGQKILAERGFAAENPAQKP